MLSFAGGLRRSPCGAKLQTPPGPEGSNGSDGCGRWDQSGAGRIFGLRVSRRAVAGLVQGRPEMIKAPWYKSGLPEIVVFMYPQYEAVI